MDMFPDIRSDDIDRIAPQCDWELQRIIERILEQGAGQSCTKLPDNPLKRKAAETDSEDEDPMPTTRPRKIVQPKKIDRAKAKKNTAECQCCFTETPLDEMVYCDGESLHLFCKRCARQAAETQIGLSKFQLDCMSMSGCDGKFTLAQRMEFLDEKLLTVLDRIELQANLRMANIEGLESCPRCHYAAEYPPIEQNRDFRCENRDCGMVSCRQCRHDAHGPKTCDDASQARASFKEHRIEEAMSEALIRKCNKCKTPFIKDTGCNKMTCTNAGCRNVQCYVCSKSCNYSHFDQAHFGGKNGNCPLHDDVEARHDDDVRKAEAAARKLVEEKEPIIADKILKKIDANSGEGRGWCATVVSSDHVLLRGF
ncbi:hypothetical protein S40288_07077 [Stachybotrys chartarum IBT 40288]|nr:hypothetical protein S40288_07077 [Stachybotrys chartarum IBT 40288]